MEDTARLALVEQDLKNRNNFSIILLELLQLINNILNNPHDYDLRTINNDILINVFDCEAFSDYLKYVGFEKIHNKFTFPKQQSLNKLRIAQAALERKINFIYGPSGAKPKLNVRSVHNKIHSKKTQLSPINVLTTNNALLLKIQSLFNQMLIYEDEDLQRLAREHIPLVTLQLMAIDRMREQQKKIKTGEEKGPDMPYDIALLMELLGWFKHKFFSWVDQPDCEVCGGATRLYENTVMNIEGESCRVELYECTRQGCGGRTKFPRFNDPRILLRSRRGRCGEWANCFTLLCRALGYDTRYIYDTTDHVWCEVWDYDSQRWLHVDPCEATLDAPLTYSHGWGKALSYVIAVARDDLQDVTWRYTTNHKEVLSRRLAVGEQQLVDAILVLRERRHAQLSVARCKYLAKRTLAELVQLMVERKPGDYESRGRISGSKEWRTQRGEVGGDWTGHSFEFTAAGDHYVRYYTSSDQYRVSCGDRRVGTVGTWVAGLHGHENMFRKVEKDWRQVYLARQDGDSKGSISWRLCAKTEGSAFSFLAVGPTAATYEDGRVDWSVQFDDEDPIPMELDADARAQFKRKFVAAVVRATLRGGVGAVAWQHAQLFRQPLDATACAFEMHVHLTGDTTD